MQQLSLPDQEYPLNLSISRFLSMRRGTLASFQENPVLSPKETHHLPAYPYWVQESDGFLPYCCSFSSVLIYLSPACTCCLLLTWICHTQLLDCSSVLCCIRVLQHYPLQFYFVSSSRWTVSVSKLWQQHVESCLLQLNQNRNLVWIVI